MRRKVLYLAMSIQLYVETFYANPTPVIYSGGQSQRTKIWIVRDRTSYQFHWENQKCYQQVTPIF